MPASCRTPNLNGYCLYFNVFVSRRAVTPALSTVPHFSSGMWSFAAPLSSSLGLAMMTAPSVIPRFGPSELVGVTSSDFGAVI